MFFRKGIIAALPFVFILTLFVFPGNSLAAGDKDEAHNAAAKAEAIAAGIKKEAQDSAVKEAASKEAEESKESSAAPKESSPAPKAASDSSEEGSAVSKEASPKPKEAQATSEKDEAPAGAEATESGQPAEDVDPESGEQATFPGVENKRLLQETEGEPQVSLWYPVLGNPVIDKDILNFIESEAKAFHEDVAEATGEDGEKPASYSTWDLSGIFSVERPSDRAISITFNTYMYSGGAHGNLGIDCLNYDLVNNRRLNFNDLFKDPHKALQLMSELSSKKLVRSLGEDADEEMIAEGTAPDPANFKNLTLTPNGLYVEFQPYQVGPWSIGPQRVELGLEELAPAQPAPSVWNIKNTSSK